MTDPQQDHWFLSLKEWIISNGGKIHPSLTIQTIPSSSSISSNNDCQSDNIHGNRTIVAMHPIPKGELLISLPSNLAISGESLPDFYYKTNPENESTGIQEKFYASSWLRCISSFMSNSTITKFSSPTKNNNIPPQEDITATSNNYSNENNENNLNFYSPYIKSLPTFYDTIILPSSWSNEQIKNYLSGTSLGKLALHDRQCNTLQLRYQDSVKRYLQYHNLMPRIQLDKKHKDNDIDNVNDDYFLLFQQACACVSTRGFHLKKSDKNDSDNEYHGPFLLPFIDLMNHTSSLNDKCTTLQRGIMTNHDNKKKNVANQEYFYMVSERSIEVGEEMLHSYGYNLTSAQLLQTFGFIEDRLIQRALHLSIKDLTVENSNINNNNNNNNNNMIDMISGDDEIVTNSLTPAILSKQEVILACTKVANSSFPNELKHILIEKYNNNYNQGQEDIDGKEDVDEYWNIPQHVESREKDISNLIPDEILIQHHCYHVGEEECYDHDILCDELVTLCTIQFLPDDAYNEFIGSSFDDKDNNIGSSKCLLSKDILEDYYLGKLVLKAILTAIEDKLATYKPIDIPVYENTSDNDDTVFTSRFDADKLLLQQLHERNALPNNRNNFSHAIYSLVIRIEEVACLLLLKWRVLLLFDSLDDSDHGEVDCNFASSNGSSSKRIKL